MNSYGIYKLVRDASWQCLIDFNITSLPVDVVRIAKDANIRLIKNSDVQLLTIRESGRTILQDGVWYVVYDDFCEMGRRRFTVAHELGHIMLGHSIIGGQEVRRLTGEWVQSERDAEVFASRLLAPACVLWGLGIHTPEDISRVCGLSFTAARIRARRMEELYNRRKFLLSPLERRVFAQFQSFIASTKNP